MTRYPNANETNWASVMNTFLDMSHNSDGSLKNLPNLKTDFGAVGDGTDATSAFTAALAAADASGNDRGFYVYVPRGVYPTDALTHAAATPVRFIGEVATMGNITGSNGVTITPRANNQTIFTIGDGVTTYQEGAIFENINFYANGFTGCTGLKFTGVNHWTVSRCGFKDLGIGLEQRASASTDNAWNLVSQCSWYNCGTAAIKCYDAFGLVVLGGDMQVPEGGNAYGMYLTGGTNEASQSIRAYGLFIDGISHASAGTCTGVYIERAHECVFEGLKFEQLDYGVNVTNLDGGDSTAGAANTFINCMFSATSNDTAINVQANASDTFIIAPSMSSVGTAINNSGARTRVFGGRLDVTHPIVGTTPEMIGVGMPDGGSGRFSQTRLGTGSSADQFSLFGATPQAKLTVTGSRGGNAALASLLTQLAAYGLITDSSS